MLITRPLTEDGCFGFDQYGQLVLTRHQSNGMTISTFVADVRFLTCALCTRGWELNATSIADQYSWDLIKEVVHLSCLARHTGFIERADVYYALVNARVRFNGLRAIPNGYYGPNDEWGKHKPWYVTELLDHPVMFEIGHRKNVWSIECRAQGPTDFNWFKEAEAQFKEEDVTKSFTPRSIRLHAWGTTRMIEYVWLICEVGGLGVKRED